MTTIILLAIVAIMILLLGWDAIQKPKKEATTTTGVEVKTVNKTQKEEKQAPPVSHDMQKPAL